MSKDYALEVEGMNDLLDMLVRGGRDAVAVSGRYLYSHATRVFERSQYEVPVDTGALRSSGFITQPYVTGNQVAISIVYGQAAAPYALWVHENLEQRHAPPTKSKYLEDPLTESLEDFRRGFRKVLEDAVEGRY